MNKHVMENATTGQQRQFLPASPPLKWPLLVPKQPSRTRIDKHFCCSWENDFQQSISKGATFDHMLVD